MDREVFFVAHEVPVVNRYNNPTGQYRTVPYGRKVWLDHPCIEQRYFRSKVEAEEYITEFCEDDERLFVDSETVKIVDPAHGPYR